MAENNLDGLAPLLATYLVHSTLWIGGCGALLWLTRVRNPAIRHAAWKCSVVAGFVTAISQFTLPLASNRFEWTFAASADAALPIAQPYRSTNILTVASPPSIDVSGAHQEQARSPELSPAKTILMDSAPSHEGESATYAGSGLPEQISHAEAFAGSPLHWLTIVVWFWLAGVVLLLIRMLLIWRRLGILGDLKELTTGKERELLDRLLAAKHIRRPVRLFRSQSGSTPMAWGFWYWRIAVPGSLVEQLDRRELRALLAHELAHLARGDTRWLCAWSVLGAAGFFQPLNRIAHQQIRRAAELLSDSWATQTTGDRLSLARALMKTAELRSGLAMPLASLAVASSSALAERVDRLIGNDTAARGESETSHWSLAVVASLAIAAAVAWMPSVKLTAAANSAEHSASEEHTASAEHTARNTGGASPVPQDDSMRAVDLELALLDAELGQLQPLVAATDADEHVVEAWRAIERRRAKLRNGHVRVKHLMEQVTSGTSSRAGNP